MNTKVVWRIGIFFPVALDFAASVQIVLSPLFVPVFRIILVAEQTEMNPFLVFGVENFELFRRSIRDVDFGSFSQIFFCIFLNKSEV
jgi:hypothetical protein